MTNEDKILSMLERVSADISKLSSTVSADLNKINTEITDLKKLNTEVTEIKSILKLHTGKLNIIEENIAILSELTANISDRVLILDNKVHGLGLTTEN